ncbi:hypothetical protein AC578_10860 [Pseudocercospora eumusae]|uniref:Uncharacterized protein n=1 Tax=Pseudocercospora eumusae TaxID=321146 RepID=A0A139H8T3_9PEZI|nr:hypothetical protein AC578_10860 [Pseudocercospora eumusae]
MDRRLPRRRLTAALVFTTLLSLLAISRSYDSSYTTERVHARALRQHVQRSSESTLVTLGGVEYGDLVDRSWDHAITSKHDLLERAPTTVQPASAEVYKRAEQKGNELICWMEDPSLAGDLATSKWTKWEQLKEWGWNGFKGGNPITTNWGGEDDPKIAELVGGESIYDQERGKQIRLYHSEEHAPETINGVTYKYPKTDAHLENNVYPEHGLILASFVFSPEYQIKTVGIQNWNEATDRAPRLQHLSDVWWLMWQKLTTEGAQRKGLRYVVQHSVVNPTTVAVLTSVMQKHAKLTNGKAPPGNGLVITRDMDGFAALLGTPSVSGVPFMLIQRHGELGKRSIKQITVWDEDPNRPYQPHVLIELEAAA